jgi:DNA mismatch repair protein MSH4
LSALSEGRGHARGEVGIAAISINSPSLILCQLSDNFWYVDTMSKIQVLNPTEILVPDTFCDSKFNSKLMDFLQDTFPTVPLVPVPRKNFNDAIALEQIDNLCLSKYKNIRLVIEKK